MAGTADRPQIVKVGGEHWLVYQGTGHQITGTSQLRYATIMYGPVVEQDAVSWERGEILFDLIPPTEIEKIAQGESADPFGWWLVQTSEPAVEITPEEAAFIGGDPEATPVDGTTEDDAISIRLPDLLPPLPPPDPEGVTGPQPDLAEQIQGATADRTPGLAMPEITPYVSPTAPVPATEEPPPPAPPAPAGPTDSPNHYERPSDTPVPGDPGGPPPYSRPGVDHYERGSAREEPERYDRPSPEQGNPYNRPSGAPYPRPGLGHYGRGSGSSAQSYSSSAPLRPVNTLPPPRFPLLRSFLNRHGQPASWLDSIEGGR